MIRLAGILVACVCYGRKTPLDCGRVAQASYHGWRDTTVDIDAIAIPDPDAFYRTLPELKESLKINIELACPADLFRSCPGGAIAPCSSSVTPW